MPAGISEEMLALTLTGISIVFGVLALIAMVVGVFGRLDEWWSQTEGRPKKEGLNSPQHIDDTTLILIAATAATVMDGRFRVRRIRRLMSSQSKRTSWSAQGRLILQGSHAVAARRVKK